MPTIVTFHATWHPYEALMKYRNLDIQLPFNHDKVKEVYRVGLKVKTLCSPRSQSFFDSI